jgi:hypothetical protein
MNNPRKRPVYASWSFRNLRPFGLLLLALAFTALQPLQAQQTATLQGVAKAIQSGNARALAGYFDQSVDVTILNKEGSYSKAQAEGVVKDFFAKHRPSGFQIIHKGESGGNAKYAIGKLSTPQGTFRTYIYVKKRGEGLLIQQLRFESD